MPKSTKYPRLRTHIRKGKGGRVYVYYFYDRRPDGQPDVPLGKDRETAIAEWEELHLGRRRIRGRITEAIQQWLRDRLPSYTNAGTRRNFNMHIRRVDAVFGMMSWQQVTLPMLAQYLQNRRNAKDPTKSAAVQANREMAVFQIVWNWARLTFPDGRSEAFTALHWPAAGLEKAKWKNKEKPRKFKVTSKLFAAVYVQACQFLQDTMDLSSATGMRLTDCINVELPPDSILHLTANKTEKENDFDLSLSAVLPALLARRRDYDANHDKVISTPDGFPVGLQDLRREWDKARIKAALKARADGNEKMAVLIEAMYLRDMRRFAADHAKNLEEARKLLQHASESTTRVYRPQGDVLTPVR